MGQVISLASIQSVRQFAGWQRRASSLPNLLTGDGDAAHTITRSTSLRESMNIADVIVYSIPKHCVTKWKSDNWQSDCLPPIIFVSHDATSDYLVYVVRAGEDHRWILTPAIISHGRLSIEISEMEDGARWIACFNSDPTNIIIITPVAQSYWDSIELREPMRIISSFTSFRIAGARIRLHVIAYVSMLFAIMRSGDLEQDCAIDIISAENPFAPIRIPRAVARYIIISSHTTHRTRRNWHDLTHEELLTIYDNVLTAVARDCIEGTSIILPREFRAVTTNPRVRFADIKI